MNENLLGTIEHDYQHYKTYCESLEFVYTESLSKQYFLRRLLAKDYQPDDNVDLEKNAIQLAKVEKIGADTESAIHDLSDVLVKTQEKLKLLNKDVEAMEVLNIKLDEEYNSLEIQDVNLQEVEELSSLYDSLYKEANGISGQIRTHKDILSGLEHRYSEEELETLRSKRDELLSKQRRLSVINLENYIEDQYNWYNLALAFVKKLFRLSVVEVETKKKIVFKAGSNEMEVLFRDGKISCIKINGEENAEERYNNWVANALVLNDIQNLLLHLCCS